MIKRLLWWPILQIERFYTFLRYWRRYEDDEGTLTLSYSKKLNDSTVKSRYNYVYRYDWEKMNIIK